MNKTDFVEEAKQESLQIKDRKGRSLMILLLALLLLLLAVSATSAIIVYRATLDSAQQGQGLAQQVQAACADPARSTEDFGSLCAEAQEVVDDAPEAVKGDPGPQGDTGDPGPAGAPGPGPSSAQVSRAVAAYCSDNECGTRPTANQVVQAVANYCDANGQCRGPQGQTGIKGADGAPGAAGQDGAEGPGPSGEAIAAAVINYCEAHNGCMGPEGNPGTPGDTVVGGTCQLAFLGLGEPVSSGTVVGSITLTVTRNGVEEEITIPCNEGEETP